MAKATTSQQRTQTATTEPLRHAVVFSGGGADGAYEVGVAKALFAGLAGTGGGRPGVTGGVPLDPDIFTGTSIGSFNASFLTSHWEDHRAGAAGNLESVWIERMSWQGGVNGGYRLRVAPFELFDPRQYLPNPLRPFLRVAGDLAFLGWEGVKRSVHLVAGEGPLLERALETFNLSSFVSVDPWQETIEAEIDFEKIRQAKKKLTIAATNWIEGRLEFFKNRDMTDKRGPAAIRASSAVPGFYPAAKVGAHSFVDGAVLMNTPLRPAIKDGAEVLHVIYMNTDVGKMAVDAMDSTLETLYRSQMIGWASAVNRDIAMARKLNDSSKYNPLTIHRYFPPDGLDGALGFLDIRQARLKQLIRKGFDNAVNHDCAEAECVLPEVHEGRPVPSQLASS